MKNLRNFFVMLTLLFLSGIVTNCLAQTYTWTGAQNTSWTDPANWTGGNSTPGPNNTVIIPNTTNDPILGNTSTITISELQVQTGAILTIEVFSVLNVTKSVGGNTNTCITNDGTIINEGKLNLTENGATTGIALQNNGVFQNKSSGGGGNAGSENPNSGNLIITDVSGNGIGNAGTLTNFSNSNINISNVGGYLGISTVGLFTNNASIIISEVVGDINSGIRITGISATFTNGVNGVIDITGSERGITLSEGATLNNNGIIYLDENTDDPISMTSNTGFSSTINNNVGGVININQRVSAISRIGIFVNGSSFNNIGGRINIDDTSSDPISRAIQVSNSSVFKNEDGGIINLGELTNNIGAYAISVSTNSSFTNNSCSGIINHTTQAEITVFNFATDYFINSGWIKSYCNTDSRISNNIGSILNYGSGTFEFTGSGNNPVIEPDPLYTHVWIGEENSDWTNLCNWAADALPDATSRVWIERMFNNYSNPTLADDAQIQALGISAVNTSTLTINSGVTLTVDGSPSVGVLVEGSLVNNGTLDIDNTVGAGLQISNDITLGGKTYIGKTGNVGGAGILTDVGATLEIGLCAEVYVYEPLTLNEELINKGLLFVNTTETHSGSINNIGVVDFPVDRSGLTIINRDLLIEPFNMEGCSANDVLSFGGFNDFTPATTWYSDANHTMVLGTYDNGINSFDLSVSIVAGAVPVYFTVSGNGCTFNVETQYININEVPANNTLTWEGTFNNEWTEPCNWSPAIVPTANEDVLIPDQANDPIIRNGVMAAAKSMVVQPSAQLTIENGGRIDISNSVGDGVYNQGIITCEFNTLFIITDASGNGLYNASGGTMNNRGTLNITNPGGHGLVNNNGTFNNNLNGTIDISMNSAPIGKNGIELLAGNFSNNASNATIFSIVPNGKAIHINGGTLTNQGYITTIGDLTVAASGTLTTEVNGTGFTSYGQIVLNFEGAAYLDGTINATVNYTPNEGNRIPFINMANSVSGTFVSENLPSSWFTDYSVGTEVALKYCTSVFYADTDGDGYGDPAVSVPLCNAPSGYVLDNTDCDDNNADKFPGNPEICDGYDNNCDGTVDEGLNGLTYVGDVGFQDQSAIDAWPGCYTSISGNLFFFDGSSITDLSPLTNLTSVGGDLVISFCDALPDLDGLENITSLGGEIIISYNENLLNVDGLNGLSSVIGSLFFYNNSKLSNLDGLANITSIISEVIISSNPQLTDLDGFSNVTSVGDFLQITSNAGLSDCCGIHYLLETPGAVGNFILIDNNDTGCDSQAEVETDCGDADNDGYSVNDGDCDDSDPNLNPGIIEICNGIDDNCDGQIDEGFDQDNDGYTTCAGDCNDTDANVNPSPNCSGTTRTWTGHISTDWEEACNWSPNCVPTSNDNVIIPNVANDPVIAAPSMVSVKSVRVNAGGHLTVSSDASLTINFSTQYGLDNRGGKLTNEGTIVIDITGSIGIFNRSGSTFDNTGTIHIGQNGGLNNIGGVGIWNEAIFNHSGTLITIDNTQGGGSGIENANMGTFTNAGLLLIGRSGEAGNIGSSGISNGGTFKHNASEIGIDNAHNGIYNYNYGIFHNSATINIGLDEGELNISDVGISNLGSFYQFDGQINIDNTGRFAISNANAGLFANLSIINIGQNDGVGGGIENTSTINHNAGQINIDNAGAPAGIYNDGGNFNNFAVLNIGQNSGPDNMASIGILNLSGADFSHNSSQINIDHTVNEGIQNAAGTTFYNYSTIVIGETGATGNAAVSNSGFFLNNTCAIVEIISDNIISNPGNFINRGLLIEHASGTSNISTNDGIVNNLNGGTFSIANNNEILMEATTASDCASISPAFGLGATVDFNILGVFTDEDATQSAGTYDVASNTFTPTNSLTLSTYIFYARIEDPVGGCTNVVEWPVVNNASLVTCYLDNDGDTYGDPSNSQVFCDVCGTGYVTDNTDCDDENGDEFPDQVWYIDADGDGYGVSSITTCERPANGFLLNEIYGNGLDDCDDNDADEFPGQAWYPDSDNDGYRGGAVLIGCERPAGHKTAEELINTTDIDCNDSDPLVYTNQTWFEDMDNDGYHSGTLLISCNRPTGFKLAAELISTTDVDCDDTDANEFPGQAWYSDFDNDGYFGGLGLAACERPAGYKLLSELIGLVPVDCNDIDPAVFMLQTWYEDMDGDNYTTGIIASSCSRPNGFKLASELVNTTDIDCNDTDANANPNPDCSGTTRTWTGHISTDWDETCNWSPNCVPTVNDDVVIPNRTNDPVISATTIALTKSVTVQTGAQLIINAQGSLSIDGSTANGLNNSGSVENFGTIQIGHATAATGYGINNGGSITNDGGVISVKNTGNAAIRLFQINASLSNLNGGEINIGQDGGYIDNNGLILFNSGAFVNNNGVLRIDNVSGNAFSAYQSTVENNNGGQILIGQTQGNIGSTGIYYSDFGTTHFTNDAGIIKVDAHGGLSGIELYLEGSSSFYNTNGGQIVLAENTVPTGTTLLIKSLSSQLTNDACSDISIVGQIENKGTLLNSGFLKIDHGGAHINTLNITNLGVVNYLQDSPIPNVNNEEVIIAPTSTTDCITISPAFGLGATVDFNILGIFTDENATLSAGTFDVGTNTFIPTNTLSQATTVFYVKIEDPIGGCTRTVEWTANSSTTAVTCYLDNDGDSFGDPANSQVFCDVCGTGFVADNTDCDDNDANEFPGQIWYIDEDGDSYGGSVFNACVRPANGFLLGELSGSGTDDCNDNDASINPAATEVCDGIDNDCDGLTDSADPSFVDNTAPTVNCQNIDRNLNLNGTASITAANVYESGSDDCGTVNLVGILPNTFDCGNLGANTVTLTVNDGNGNDNSCTAIVTINDVTAPVATCQDLTVGLDANGNASITATQVDNGSSDNCSVISTSLNITSFTCTNVGASTVTLTVSDSSGNSNDCNATITVEDNVDPNAQCIASALQVTLDANGEYTIDPNTLDNGSNDACGIQGLTASPTLLNCSNEGQNSITLTVTDVNGNTASCTATVEVANFFTINGITATDETCAGMGDGSIIISATTGGGQIGYSIDGGASFQFNNAFYSLAPGTYNIVVKIFGINGLCEKTATATVDAGGQAQTWYRDMDGDGYSNGMSMLSCSQPSGYYLAASLLAISGDCNDSDENEFPGQLWYADNDGDGYTSGTSQLACSRPVGFKTALELASTTDIDCNDSESTIHPFATEICNGIDDDCDGEIDENTTGGLTYNGNIAFYTQADVDAFSQCYAIINGSLIIQGAGITNLSNLSNLEEVTGNLTIQFNGITSMAGLDNLTEVGGTVTIYFNSSLTTLDGLDALGSVGGNLFIYYNFLLSDGCAIYNLINGGVGGSMSIFFNKVGCNSIAEIIANCGPNSLVANPGNTQTANSGHSRQLAGTDLSVFPNPTTGFATVQFGEMLATGKVRVLDIAGRIVLEKELSENTTRINLDLSGWKAGTYLIQVLTTGNQPMTKRLVVID